VFVRGGMIRVHSVFIRGLYCSVFTRGTIRASPWFMSNDPWTLARFIEAQLQPFRHNLAPIATEESHGRTRMNTDCW